MCGGDLDENYDGDGDARNEAAGHDLVMVMVNVMVVNEGAGHDMGRWCLG